jgi:hypothetical protein
MGGTAINAILGVAKADNAIGTNSVTADLQLLTHTGNLRLTAELAGKSIILETSDTERARISSGGNLLIGTTTDDGANKLQVTGHAIVSETTKTSASTATRTGLSIPHGVAPTSPVNGDMWTTTAGLYVQINGATVGPLS